MTPVALGSISIGAEGDPLAVIAGPCVAESLELCRTVARQACEICSRLDVPYIFKASFDKANRTSGSTFRGRGIDEGLEILAAIKAEFGVPVVTDVHESAQCSVVAEVCDMLQIPAFLCRQTDLLVAAAETGRAVNVKKGQFLAPWDCENIVAKIAGAGNENILLCERGTSFGYNTLIVDMRGLPIMRALGRPVVFDGTHSVQQPGGLGSSSGGQREFIPHLVRGAVATGAVDALFLETHPDPAHALSDAATQLPLDQLEALLGQAVALYKATREFA